MFDQKLRMAEVLQQSKHRYNLKHRFEIVKSLGQGTYGKVKLAIDKKTGNKVAIKSIAKRKIACEQDLTRIRREIEIMASLSHKHTVQIFEVFENKDKIILVMEYADGGELYDFISVRGRLCEKEARSIFRQIVSAVHHLHENGIVHRDLKLENILLDKNGNVKLADFGLSNTWHHNRFLQTYCGSPLYASPEIVNGRPYYGPEVDCWSLGVLLYTLVYGAMPFDGSDFNRLKKQISTGDYYEPTKPAEAASLIRRLLTVNPAKRANVMDIAAHWWTNKDCNDLQDDLAPCDKRTSDYFEGDNEFSDGDLMEKTSPERIVTPAFDSNKKPKKGILKNHRKMSNSDSGCGLSDTTELSLATLTIHDSSSERHKAQSEISPSSDVASLRPRSISLRTVTLKTEENIRRNSVSSNSSSDLLDFSCDSSDCGATSPAYSVTCDIRADTLCHQEITRVY